MVFQNEAGKECLVGSSSYLSVL